MFLLFVLCFQMDKSQRRLEQGLSPYPEKEEEWRKMLQDKKRRQRDKEEKERVKKHTRLTKITGQKLIRALRDKKRR